MMIKAVNLILCLALSFHASEAALADTWTYCDCRFDEWEAWSECNSDCFGERVRTRSVWLTQNPGCDEFTDCATNDEGEDWETCNAVCHNGGTATGFIFPPCNCQAGYHGLCCTERVNCGTPDDVVDGTVTWTTTDYGGDATYTCDNLHNMTGGDGVRTCQNDFTWSGSAPQCLFAYHCDSSPCLNGATCVNLLGDFLCECPDGWSGTLCEHDIQPPVMTNCSEDIPVNATDRTVLLDWAEPSFYDPMGNDLDIVSNYPSPSFTFPWGDHVVQYVATKPSNGLTTECAFTIKVRPTPCEELNVPVNGARVCNGWKTDYGRFCIVTCQQNYTIGPGYSFDTMYVCGASGNWIAASPTPDCLVPVVTVEQALQYQPKYNDYSFQDACADHMTQKNLKDLYLERLLSSDGFPSFCTNYPDECIPDNVDIRCGDLQS